MLKDIKGFCLALRETLALGTTGCGGNNDSDRVLSYDKESNDCGGDKNAPERDTTQILIKAEI